MKVRVLVAPRCTAGNNKGGEDLHLDAVAYFDGDTPPENPEYEVALSLVEADGVSTNWDWDDDFEESHTTEHKVGYKTCFYEFEWEGTGADLLKEKDYEGTFKEQLDAAEWEFCHKPGEAPRLRKTLEWYCGGNAD